jgi:DNA gyrase subunit B
MDPQQLWETTLDPEHRIMRQVQIDDARMASEMTELLMGTEVPPRKDFIHAHATDAAVDA